MRKRLELAMNVVLVTCAVAMTGAVIYGNWNSRRSIEITRSPEFFGNFPEMLAAGRTTGSPAAAIQIVEFSDLECPFCARFHQETFPELERRYPGELALTFVHYPLEMHRSALPAAVAAECAAGHGRFFEFVAVIFEAQRGLGVLEWTEFGERAGIEDLERFERCTTDRSADPPTKVADGLALAAQAEFTGTPSLIVNGWFVPDPSVEELSRVIDALLHGEVPYDL